MSHRGQSSSFSRVLAVVAASAAVGGLLNCAAFPSAARDGTLSATLTSASPRVTARAARARAARGALIAAASGTYIEQCLLDRDSTLERWPDHVDHPLRVWIDSSATIDGAQAGFPAAVRAAFRDWSATGIPLRFTFVDSPRDAEIRVRWTDHLNHKTGSTTWRTDHNGWMLAGDITLATHISDGQPLDARGMRAIALHETGHALGLSHSTDPSDIMAGLVRVDGLSVPDRNTVRLLYSMTAGPVP
jgi:predicted Zn-dependent protease